MPHIPGPSSCLPTGAKGTWARTRLKFRTFYLLSLECWLVWNSVVRKCGREKLKKVQNSNHNLYSYLLKLLAKTNKGQCCQWRKTTFLWKSHFGKWLWIIRFLQTEEERVGLELILYLFCAISLDAFGLVFLLTVHCCFFRICIWQSSGLPFKWDRNWGKYQNRPPSQKSLLAQYKNRLLS